MQWLPYATRTQSGSPARSGENVDMYVNPRVPNDMVRWSLSYESRYLSYLATCVAMALAWSASGRVGQGPEQLTVHWDPSVLTMSGSIARP